MRGIRRRSRSGRPVHSSLLAALALFAVAPAGGQQEIEPEQVIFWDETQGPGHVMPNGAAFGGSVGAAKSGPGLAAVGTTGAHGLALLLLNQGSWVTWVQQTYDVGPQPFASGHDGETANVMISLCCDPLDRYVALSIPGGQDGVVVTQDTVRSVAKHGDLIAVGQPFRGAGGAVSFYRKNAQGEWQFERRFDGATGNEVGYSLVLLSSNLALVGLPGRNNGGGEVWIAYTDPTSGTFSPLLAGSGGGERFGHSLAADGAWIAVGSPLHDRLLAGGGVVVNAGAVWLYEWEGFGWSFRTRFRGATPHGNLGWDVDLRTFSGGGATLVAGEPGYTNNKGAANVYELDDGTWRTRYRLFASTSANTVFAGRSVALATPSRVLVGAPYWGAEVKGAVLAYFVPLFADGFESGSTDAWSAVTP